MNLADNGTRKNAINKYVLDTQLESRLEVIQGHTDWHRPTDHDTSCVTL